MGAGISLKAISQLSVVFTGRKAPMLEDEVMSSERQAIVQIRAEGYTVIKTIGKGSSATVKLARRNNTKEVVAIKIIDISRLDAGGMKRVNQEITVWENLKHPGVIELYDIIATDTHFMFVCEYAAGGDLLEFIRKNGKLNGKEAKRVCSQLIAALDYCHKQGVVNRDMKLENVLLDQNGNAKLADWGFGRFFSINASSRIKEWCGSPPYAAPEIFLGRPYYGPGIDIWSLGVVIYGIVTGKLPFDADNFDGVSAKVLSGNFAIPFFMPLECEHLIRGMLHKNMEKRFSMKKIKQHPWLDLDRQASPFEGLSPPRPRARPRSASMLDPRVHHSPRGTPKASKPPSPLAFFDSPKPRPRPASCDPTIGCDVTPEAPTKPQSKTPLAPQLEQLSIASRRLFFRAITKLDGVRRNVFMPMPKGIKGSSNSAIRASSRSLPTVIDVEAIEAENQGPSEAQPRFPCSVCHTPQTACWDFQRRSPSRCQKCEESGAEPSANDSRFTEVIVEE